MAVYLIEEIQKFSEGDWKRFLNTYYYGLPEVKLKDLTDLDLLNSAIQYCNKELHRVTLSPRERSYYEVWIERLRFVKKDAKKKLNGTYEIENAIESDIWDCVGHGGREVDWDKLAEVRNKYKDYKNLYQRIKKRILDKEMWYD